MNVSKLRVSFGDGENTMISVFSVIHLQTPHISLGYSGQDVTKCNWSSKVRYSRISHGKILGLVRIFFKFLLLLLLKHKLSRHFLSRSLLSTQNLK